MSHSELERMLKFFGFRVWRQARHGVIWCDGHVRIMLGGWKNYENDRRAAKNFRADLKRILAARKPPRSIEEF